MVQGKVITGGLYAGGKDRELTPGSVTRRVQTYVLTSHWGRLGW